MSFPTLPTTPLNILLTPERGPGGVDDYLGLWRNTLPTELNRLERLIANASAVTNTITSTYIAPYRGTVTIGASATAFDIIHNLNLPAPYTAVVVIWNSSGVQINNATTFTGSTFTANEVAYTMLSTALPAGTYSVYVSGG